MKMRLTLVLIFIFINSCNFYDLVGEEGKLSDNFLDNINNPSTDQASIVISNGPTYDFGNTPIGTLSAATLTLDNFGGSDATGLSGSSLATPYSFSGGSYPGGGGTCGSFLAAGSNCTISIDFNPVSAGPISDTVVISYFDGVTNVSSTRDITGNGVSSALLTLSEGDPYDYGAISIGSTTLKSFVITNNGASDATSISDAFTLTAPFSFSGSVYPGSGGDCGTFLAVGGSCTIEVEFLPTTVNNFTSTLQIDYFDGVTTTSLVTSLVGEGI